MQVIVFPVSLYRSKLWTLKKQCSKSINNFECYFWEKTVMNSLGSPKNKQMDHKTRQARGTNEQAQIILLCPHYAKIKFTEKGCHTVKGGRKGKKWTASNKVGRLLQY